MKPPDDSWLVDMLEAARLIVTFVQGVSQEEFEGDLMRQSAVHRQLEIMGEAAKQVSPGFRTQHPEIPWRQIAGMRDVLIHAYRKVQADEVWRAATGSVPPLIPVLETLVPGIEESNES